MKMRLYKLMSLICLVVVLICETKITVNAENFTQAFTRPNKSVAVSLSGNVSAKSVGYIYGATRDSVLISMPSLSSSGFDMERPITLNVSYDLTYNRGTNSSLSYLGNSYTTSGGISYNSSVVLEYGSKTVNAGCSTGSYNYNFTYDSSVSSILVDITSCQKVQSTSSVSGTKKANDSFSFSNIVLTFSQEMTELEITQQPADNIYAEEGETVSFGIEAVGDDLSYQWQSDSSGTWSDVLYTSSAVSLSMSEDLNGCSYRCIVSDKYGKQLTSEEITLYYVTPLQITQQPVENIYAEDGETVSFSIAAVGDGLSYQWQSDSSGTWSDVSYTSNMVSLSMSESLSGCTYRCVVTDKYGVQLISNEVHLHVVISEDDNVSEAPVKVELNGNTIDLPMQNLVSDEITFSVDCDEYETFTGTTQMPIDISSIGFSNVKENDNVLIYGDFDAIFIRSINQYTDVLSDELIIELYYVDALGPHRIMHSSEEDIHDDYIAFTARGPVTSMYFKLIFEAECKCKSSMYRPVSYGIHARFNNFELTFRHSPHIDEEGSGTETESESENVPGIEPDTETETENNSESGSGSESGSSSESGSDSGSESETDNSEIVEGTEVPELTEDMKKFVGFMGVIIDFVKTEFTIYGHTFSYWQVIVLSCIGSIVGIFIRKVF